MEIIPYQRQNAIEYAKRWAHRVILFFNRQNQKKETAPVFSLSACWQEEWNQTQTAGPDGASGKRAVLPLFAVLKNFPLSFCAIEARAPLRKK